METIKELDEKTVQELKELYREMWGKKNVWPIKKKEVIMDLVIEQKKNEWSNINTQGLGDTSEADEDWDSEVDGSSIRSTEQ